MKIPGGVLVYHIFESHINIFDAWPGVNKPNVFFLYQHQLYEAQNDTICKNKIRKAPASKWVYLFFNLYSWAFAKLIRNRQKIFNPKLSMIIKILSKSLINMQLIIKKRPHNFLELEKKEEHSRLVDHEILIALSSNTICLFFVKKVC